MCGLTSMPQTQLDLDSLQKQLTLVEAELETSQADLEEALNEPDKTATTTFTATSTVTSLNPLSTTTTTITSTNTNTATSTITVNEQGQTTTILTGWSTNDTMIIGAVILVGLLVVAFSIRQKKI